MANKNIVEYLEANRVKFPPELLVAELRKAGHAEGEIQEALRTLGVGSIAPAQGGTSTITAWGKVWRFLVGFITGIVISFVLMAGVIYIILLILSRNNFDVF